MKTRQKRAIWYSDRAKKLEVLAKAGAVNIHGNTWQLRNGVEVIGKDKAIYTIKKLG